MFSLAPPRHGHSLAVVVAQVGHAVRHELAPDVPLLRSAPSGACVGTVVSTDSCTGPMDCVTVECGLSPEGGSVTSWRRRRWPSRSRRRRRVRREKCAARHGSALEWDPVGVELRAPCERAARRTRTPRPTPRVRRWSAAVSQRRKRAGAPGAAPELVPGPRPVHCADDPDALAPAASSKEAKYMPGPTGEPLVSRPFHTCSWRPAANAFGETRDEPAPARRGSRDARGSPNSVNETHVTAPRFGRGCASATCAGRRRRRRVGRNRDQRHRVHRAAKSRAAIQPSAFMSTAVFISQPALTGRGARSARTPRPVLPQHETRGTSSVGNGMR